MEGSLQIESVYDALLRVFKQSSFRGVPVTVEDGNRSEAELKGVLSPSGSQPILAVGIDGVESEQNEAGYGESALSRHIATFDLFMSAARNNREKPISMFGDMHRYLVNLCRIDPALGGLAVAMEVTTVKLIQKFEDGRVTVVGQISVLYHA